MASRLLPEDGATFAAVLYNHHLAVRLSALSHCTILVAGNIRISIVSAFVGRGGRRVARRI